MRLILAFVIVFSLSAEDKKLSDVDARKYLNKKTAAVKADNAVLLRYVQFKQQQEAQQKAFEADIAALQSAAQAAGTDLNVTVETLRTAAKCDKCTLNDDLHWVEKK